MFNQPNYQLRHLFVLRTLNTSLPLSLSLRLSFSTSVTCQIIVEYYYVLLLLLLFFSGIDLMRQCCHVIARQTVERAKRSVFMRYIIEVQLQLQLQRDV